MLRTFPTPAVPRTPINSPALRQKAIAFLDKNYKRLNPTEVQDTIYMLEPKSINGMKKIRSQASQRKHDDYFRATTVTQPIIDYKINRNGKEEVYKDFPRSISIPDKEIKWYRLFGFGTSAIDAELGGKTRRKSRSRQRKTRRS